MKGCLFEDRDVGHGNEMFGWWGRGGTKECGKERLRTSVK